MCARGARNDHGHFDRSPKRRTEACQVLGTVAAVIPHAREQAHADDRVSYRLFDDSSHAGSEADVW